jgi:hypothetical protein
MVINVKNQQQGLHPRFPKKLPSIIILYSVIKLNSIFVYVVSEATRNSLRGCKPAIQHS